MIKRRDLFLGGTSLAAAALLSVPVRAQAPVPRLRASATKLFDAPALYPNCLAASDDGLWVAQEVLSPERAQVFGLPIPDQLGGDIWLMDWRGELLRSFPTEVPLVGGLAFGNDCLWSGANAAPYGIHQLDLRGQEITKRQIPLGTTSGGGCNGAAFHEDRLWLFSGRLNCFMRIEPESWTPEVILPIPMVEEYPRLQDMTFDDDGNILLAVANLTSSFATLKGGLLKIDPTTAELLEIIDMVEGSPDPHGLSFHEGRIICCDAGVRPGWNTTADLSPRAGEIFSIEIV